MGCVSTWIINMTVVITSLITTVHSDGPNFLSKPNTVKVDTGGIAVFPCSVDNLGPQDRVAWYSMTMSKLLTIDVFTLSANNHVIVNVDRIGGFQLQINNVTSEDAGGYKCIITTEPVMEQTSVLRVTRRRGRSRRRKAKHIRNPSNSRNRKSHMET